MLQVLLFAMPSVVIIFSLYLFFFQKPLVKILQLPDHKIIRMVALTFLLLGILGFILVYLRLELLSIIWLVVILLLITLLSVLIYFSLKK